MELVKDAILYLEFKDYIPGDLADKIYHTDVPVLDPNEPFILVSTKLDILQELNYYRGRYCEGE